jgi:hypothetical protein
MELANEIAIKCSMNYQNTTVLILQHELSEYHCPYISHTKMAKSMNEREETREYHEKQILQ